MVLTITSSTFALRGALYRFRRSPLPSTLHDNIGRVGSSLESISQKSNLNEYFIMRFCYFLIITYFMGISSPCIFISCLFTTMSVCVSLWHPFVCLTVVYLTGRFNSESAENGVRKFSGYSIHHGLTSYTKINAKTPPFRRRSLKTS